MPAAAVIPAPIAYILFAVVEKLVVKFRARPGGPSLRRRVLPLSAGPFLLGNRVGRVALGRPARGEPGRLP